MSHSYIYEKTTFIGNSDLSGDITIKNNKGELNVNGNDILDFIIEHLKREAIANIESSSNDEFVKNFIKTR